MRFELDQYNRNVPDEELIADIKRVASELGIGTVTRLEQNRMGRFSATTYIRRFGSWSNACAKADLAMRQTLPNRPDEEMIENLEELWIALGRQPLYSEVTKHPEVGKPASKFSVAAYEKRYGGWRKALEAFVSFINEAEDSSSESSNHIANEIELPKPAKSRHINWRLRFIVMRRDNFKCKVCGRTPARDPSVTLDVDHIKAWSKGGLTIFENLQTLCTKCNIGKSDLEFVNSSQTEVQNVEQ